MTYVSRSDWSGTFPERKLDIELTQSMMNEMTGYKDYNKEDYAEEGETLPAGWSMNGFGKKDLHARRHDRIGL